MKRRKNYLPSLLLSLFFWLIWFLILLFIPPESYFSLFTFHFSLFLALFLTLSLFLANTRRGFLISSGFILFLILRIYDLGNPLNIILLLGSIITLEIYFTKTK